MYIQNLYIYIWFRFQGLGFQDITGSLLARVLKFRVSGHCWIFAKTACKYKIAFFC